MKTWKITYSDGTAELVDGFRLRIYENVLTIERSRSYDRQPRSWPLAAVRSWEEVAR